MELRTLGNIKDSMYSKIGSSNDVGEDSLVDEELQLQWAAVERLPTFKRIRTSLFQVNHGNGGENDDQFEGKKVTDVTKLGGVERRLFIQKLIKHNENDNLRLLQRLRERIDRSLSSESSILFVFFLFLVAYMYKRSASSISDFVFQSECEVTNRRSEIQESIC